MIPVRRSRGPLIATAVFGVLICPVCRADGGGTPDTLAKWATARAQWEHQARYLDAQNYRAKSSGTHAFQRPGEPWTVTHRSVVTTKRSGANILSDWQFWNRPNDSNPDAPFTLVETNSAHGRNGQYVFGITRAKRDNNAGWLLAGLQQGTPEELATLPESFAGPLQNLTTNRAAVYFIPGFDTGNPGAGRAIPLHTVSDLPGWKLLGYDPSGGGRFTFTHQWECKHWKKPSAKPTLKTMTVELVLDERTGWPRSCDQSWADPTAGVNKVHIHHEYEFTRVGEAYFATKRVTTGKADIAGKNWRDQRVESETSYELCDSVPDIEFTLSAYGLPEPDGVVWDKPTPRYVWLLLCGTGVAGLGGLSLALRRRFRRDPAGPPPPTT